MTDRDFDRLARLLAGASSRRQALATLGALAAARLHPTRAATQIEIPACGEAGAVCTLIKGCCTGLVCATSTVNPAFGVCVAGEGGMLPVSDSILVPTADGITEELAQAVSEATGDATAAQSAQTTAEAERQAQIDAKRAKKDSRRSSRRSTNTTQRTTRRTNRSTRRTTQELNALPELTVVLFPEEAPEELPAAVDPLDTPPTDEPEPEVGQPEMVRVRNEDSVSIVLSRIESLTQPDVFDTLSVSIAAGETHLLLSGQYAKEVQQTLSGATLWTDETICATAGQGAAGAGIQLTAAQSGGTRTHVFTVLCGASVSTAHPEAGTGQQRQRNHDQHQRRRVQRRDAHHHRQDHKHATRGKGK